MTDNHCTVFRSFLAQSAPGYFREFSRIIAPFFRSRVDLFIARCHVMQKCNFRF